MREADLDLPIGAELRESDKPQPLDIRNWGSEPERTYIGNEPEPVYGSYRDASGNGSRLVAPPIRFGRYNLQPLVVDYVRKPARLHGVQRWNILDPAFQLADFGYPWHDAPVRRTFSVDKNELTAMNTEFFRRGCKVVRYEIVRAMWIEFEQGSDLGGQFWVIGEDESRHSLRWMDDLYDCGTGLPVRLPKDVVTWPKIWSKMRWLMIMMEKLTSIHIRLGVNGVRVP